MKRIYLIMVLISFYSSTKAQTNLFGLYRFFTDTYERSSLKLNCDSTFELEDTMVISKDSSTYAIVRGHWKLLKGERLILFVESIRSTLTPIARNDKKIEYTIRDGRFYLKTYNKRQYNRLKRKINRQLSTQHSTEWENYETYKQTQNNRYFPNQNARL